MDSWTRKKVVRWVAVLVTSLAAAACSDGDDLGPAAISATGGGGTGAAMAGSDPGGAGGQSAGVIPAPSELRAAAITSERVELRWLDNSSTETGFEIDRSTDAGASWETVATSVEPSYSDTGLEAAQTLSYRVRALSEAGPSAYSNVAVATTPIAGPPSIRPDHPRVWLTPENLPVVRARAEGVAAPDWDGLLADWRSAIEEAFAYALTEEPSYAQDAIGGALSEASAIRNETNDMTLRERLLRLALVYDWCYPELSDAEKQTIGNAVLYGLRWQVDEGFNGEGSEYFAGGHQHGHQAVAIIASLALLGESFALDEDYGHSAEQFFELTYDNFERGWWPIMRRIGLEGGGWYMSWMYSAGHLGRHVQMLAALRSASNADPFEWEGWTREIPQYTAFGIDDPDEMTTIITGDQGWPYFRELDYLTEIILAGTFSDPVAVGLVERMEAALPHLVNDAPAGRMHKVLWHPFDVAASPLVELPTARAFDGVGKYVLRQGWGADDLWLYVKNIPYYVQNHNHRANGHFALTYKGAHLAIDSGFYDSYGSDHHDHYTTRAIAHNTLLIDGNQSEYRWDTNPYETSIAETTVFEDRERYGVVVADYTGSCADVDHDSQSIATQKAAEMVRHVAMLRGVSGWECPVVVIVDRAVSTDPSYEKRWLLHSIDEPRIDGLTTTITEGDAKLFVQTLETSASSFGIHPRGSNADIFDASHFEDWSYQGWAPNTTDDEYRADYYTPGRWRIEVIPSEAQARDWFVHVLAPASLEVSDPPDTELIEADEAIGARVNDRVVVWGKEAAVLDAMQYDVGGEGTHVHLVGNLVPNSRFLVTVSGGTVVAEARSSRNGLLEFETPPIGEQTSYLVSRADGDR